jgi:4-hydroxybenzoate polyprenyltransferase
MSVSTAGGGGARTDDGSKDAAAGLRAGSEPLPVCVDLDGTLVAGDLLWESFVTLFRRSPVRALWTARTVLRGAAAFKRLVAEQVPLEPSALPYRQELLDELHEARRRGAPVLLVSAADAIYAQAVADHLGFFDEVVASDGRTNVSGETKAAALVARFGQQGFEYVGDDWSDLPAWRAASRATIVGGPPRLRRQLAAERGSARALAPGRHRLLALVDAMRPHQWAKNALVFIPIVAGHRLFEATPLWQTALTFVAFCLCASATYLLNDVTDVRADRRHATKARRPVAAGELSVPLVVAWVVALLASGVALAAFGVGWDVAGVLGVYTAATTFYSMKLKQVPVADVFTLTGLYVLRMFAGSAATGITLTTWLMAFALFFFLGLAFVKRYVEVIGSKGPLPGREYGPEDAIWMHAVGTGASYMAVVVLALYVNTPEVTLLYTRPDLLWLLCPLLLYWLTRLWFRAGRRLVHDDPVVETLRDPQGYVILGVAALVLLAAAA